MAFEGVIKPELYKYANALKAPPSIMRRYMYAVYIMGVSDIGGLDFGVDRVDDVQFPDLGSGEEEMFTEYGGIRYMTPQHTAPQLVISILESKDHDISTLIQLLKLRVNPMDGSLATVHRMSEKTSKLDIEVVQFHMNGKVARTNQFMNCTLSTASYGNLSYDSNEAVKISLTLNVGKWIV